MPQDLHELAALFRTTRAHTEALAAPLSPEDQQLQAMPSTSPVKWHRAHTTWFFETLVLGPFGGRVVRPEWSVLFNSYYEALGARHARPERGLLSRPSADEIGAYRRAVDAELFGLLETPPAGRVEELAWLVRLGVAHEEQHQELMLTDTLAAFFRHPLRPVYREVAPPARARCPPQRWLGHPGGLVHVGAAPKNGFRFDNEEPAHDVLLRPFSLSNRLLTLGDWSAFSADGGYETPSLWLSDGLEWVRARGIRAPEYARQVDGRILIYGLAGEREADPDEPLLFVSYYEADALARWLGARLPTEEEWELAAQGESDDVERADLVPRRGTAEASSSGLVDLFGTGWQWTRSSYEAYPGYRSARGAIGEYNGKFMVNQRVLRGSSLFTPRGHSRPSYRNFWPPETRFQATAVRLARDA